MAGKMKQKGFGFPMTKEKWFLVLLAAVAVLILLIPTGSAERESRTETAGESQVQTEVSVKEYDRALEERLKAFLSQVDGVGETEVMITLKSTEEKQVEKDSNVRENTSQETDSQGGSRLQQEYEEENTVIFAEDENGNQVPYVVKELAPEIQGVLILCEGGDSPSVQTEVYEAVEALLGVTAHKIKVLKKVSETK